MVKSIAYVQIYCIWSDILHCFFVFSFECFYSVGVQDLMIKTIRKLACEEFLAAKHAWEKP